MRPATSLLLVGLLTLAAASAAAQEPQTARSFEQLQILVRPDDTLTVDDTAGRRLKGRLVSLSDTQLVLRVDGNPIELPVSAVEAIRQRRRDSLGNGALIGLGAGAAFGATVFLAFNDGEEEPGWALLAAAFYGGVGAGIGTGIDALILRTRLIYARPGGPAASLTVSPLISRDRRGVQVALRF